MKEGLCPDMPFLVNDWLSSTTIAAMTPAEEGAYIRLLAHAWNDPDCTLPDNDALLARLSRLGADWDQGAGKVLRAVFTPDPERPGRLFNRRQREVRAEQNRRIEDAKSHARNAAHARWNKRNARALPEHCPSNAGGMLEGMHNPMLKNASSPVSPLPIEEREIARACEPPSGFPKTEAGAKAAAATVGCPEDFAVSTWNLAISRGGLDAKGNPIRSWPHFLAANWTYERNRTEKEKHAANRQSGKPNPRNLGVSTDTEAQSRKIRETLDRRKAELEKPL